MFNIYKKNTKDHPQSVYAQITVFSDPCMHLSREKGQFYRDWMLLALPCLHTYFVDGPLFTIFTIYNLNKLQINDLEKITSHVMRLWYATVNVDQGWRCWRYLKEKNKCLSISFLYLINEYVIKIWESMFLSTLAAIKQACAAKIH